MADSITYIPDQNQANNYLPWMLAGNGGWGGNGFFGGAGGSAFWGALLGGLVPGLFGGWGNGFGGFGGGAGAAASLGAQATANQNTDLIMQAINGTDADVRLLATTTGADIDSLRSGINTINTALATLAGQSGMSALQVQNAISSGNYALANQLASCCCEMKQLVQSQGYENQIATLNQTNQLGNAISGNGQRIVDAIADLKTTTVQEFCNARERDMQSEINRQAEIITQLRSQADNAAQTNAFASMLAPIANKITEIEGKIPNTVPVQWPQLTAVNTTPYVSGGYYGAGFGFNNGVTF